MIASALTKKKRPRESQKVRSYAAENLYCPTIAGAPAERQARPAPSHLRSQNMATLGKSMHRRGTHISESVQSTHDAPEHRCPSREHSRERYAGRRFPATEK